MADTNYNYNDSLATGSYTAYVSNQHDTAIELEGRKCFVFLLDKKQTEMRNVYNEEKYGRIYLPHFEQRGLYKTNTFTPSLSVANYTETEESLEIEFNFQRMVQNINALKNKSAGNLIIKNTSRYPLNIIVDDKFKIVKKNEIVLEESFEGSIYDFIRKINSYGIIDFKYVGDSEESYLIQRINTVLKPRREIELDVKSGVYKNTTDVIENGTVIVSDRYRTYQVTSAMPTNDSYGSYISWTVHCELINLAKVDGLPNDYSQIVKRKEFKLEKINRE